MKKYVIRLSNGDYLLVRNAFEGAIIGEATHFKTKAEAKTIASAIGKNKILHLTNENNLQVKIDKIFKVNVNISMVVDIIEEV